MPEKKEDRKSDELDLQGTKCVEMRVGLRRMPIECEERRLKMEIVRGLFRSFLNQIYD
jgi:hypothetical protein